MKTKEQVLSELSIKQRNRLLKHFDEIYECKELNDHEVKIIHLGWLWANGCVYQTEDGWYDLNEELAGVSLDTFEISIEGEPGGINLDLMYGFYELDKMIQIIKKKYDD